MYICIPIQLLRSSSGSPTGFKCNNRYKRWSSRCQQPYNTYGMTLVILDEHHTCKFVCHEGECQPCDGFTTVPCRCGGIVKQIACADLSNISGIPAVFFQMSALLLVVQYEMNAALVGCTVTLRYSVSSKDSRKLLLSLTS